MELFFRELVAVLDKERPLWRNSLVMIMDGASYHQSSEFFEVASKL